MTSMMSTVTQGGVGPLSKDRDEVLYVRGVARRKMWTVLVHASVLSARRWPTFRISVPVDPREVSCRTGEVRPLDP
jgi:hypothetical protein